MDLEERKKKEIEFHKSIILDTAIKIFAENGYMNTTMEEIAKASHYSKATLYKYYQAKEDLFLSILERIIKGLNQLEDSHYSKFQDDYYKTLSNHISDMFDKLDENIPVLKIFIRQAFIDQKSLNMEKVHCFLDEQMNRKTPLDQYIQKGIKDGVFMDSPVEEMRKMIYVCIFGYLETLVKQQKYDFMSRKQFIIDFVYSGLRGRKDD